MEDEDGTCLLDVLCDPQALNDFLHGTNELENEDLLISSSSGEPSLFADAPSPASLLADNTPSQDTPPPGCVDLSFLEEALLGSPEGGGGAPEVGQGGSVGAGPGEVEEEEACDILQQSLQEADITEQTLVLEAGLAPPGEALSLYPPGAVLAPAASHFLSKPLSLPPLPAMPRDTQAAVEPPQPSLLAVGPGCPSLKPAAPQMMGLLPGTVFPAPPPDASFSLSPAQGSGMLIQKALPSLTGRPLLAPTLRATAAHGILLPRGPLPIQPKLPISIQPRLVQISPKPPGQKTSPGLAFVPGAAASPNILLSPSLGPKQQPPAPGLGKQVSLQLVNQGGSIVIQPPGLLQGPNQFLLPGQTPVSVSQPGGAARPLLTASSPQGPSLRGGAPSPGQLVDGAQILTASSRQLNFSPVFTTPAGQLAVRQGALLSGPLQLQSAPPTVFQMPLAGAYPPQGQGQGQRGTLLHGTALGSQITLINSPAMLAPDMASISIVNGPSVVQGLPFAPQAQQDKQLNLPQTSVLLLPDRPGPEDRGPGEEPFLHLPQPNQQHLLQHNPQPAPTELQMPPPVVTLLQPLPEPPLQHDPASAAAAALAKHLIPPTEEQQVQKEVPNLLPQKQSLLQQMHQQALELPSPPTESLPGTLPAQMSPPSSPPAPALALANQREDAAPLLPAIGQTVALAVTPSPTVVTTPTHPGAEQAGTLIGQNTLGPQLPPVSFPSPPSGQTGTLQRAGHAKVGAQVRAGGPGGLAASPLPAGHSALQLQPVPLPVPVPMPVGPRVQTEMPVQAPVLQHTQELAAGLAVDGSLFAPAPHVLRQPAPEAPVQAAAQPRTQVTACVETEREERLTLAMRRHRVQQQLCQDHGVVLNPDTLSPFLSLEDAVSRLLPYHTCAGHLPGQAGFLTVDQQFDAVSGILLKRTKDMLNKYRQLLLGEAQQVSPSAEMVMLERLFLQAERGVLGEERRKARLDPDSFLLSLRKPASGPNNAAPSAPSSFLQAGSPPSSPSWALLSNRPPGLKTYRSSSRGALKLTIKHESGSRKVVHNSACDSAPSAPSVHGQDCAGQLTNGGGALSGRGSELGWDAPRPPQTGHPQPPACPPPPTTVEEAQHPKNSTAVAEAPTAANSRTPPDSLIAAEPQTATAPEPPPAPDPVLCPPEPKRARPDPCPGPPSPLPLPEDSTLSEHLQSAIDSILELQRLQGPPALQARPPQDRRGTSVLEQAVSSILEGHL
ncbi:BRD4-interacting chromatin-remodeling complex-associated protein [Anguilla anguilla]|uniref:BRD4-interacting chromatin-remodeling complex-associated protein n=1 Tax=Anguilla anguilla TaxID=7936 RepID=UPI0015AC81D9|nr:BRD4-interacting chromatin-remodeling complex-associated protein [Anguilla anguilla]XP_035262636.1 BRD4-interacting chromatin-remodeling complex-associated protein [Anguilla anguilla]